MFDINGIEAVAGRKRLGASSTTSIKNRKQGECLIEPTS